MSVKQANYRSAYYLIVGLWFGVISLVGWSVSADDGGPTGSDGESEGVAGAQISTDQTAYFSDDLISVSGSGFQPEERIVLTALAPIGSPTSYEPVGQWESYSSANGSYSFQFAAEFDEYIGEELRLVAEGSASKAVASASFVMTNVSLKLQYTTALALCLSASPDTVDVCATLHQRCSDGFESLAGREVMFFINAGESGDCGVGTAQVPDYVAVTDEYGNACARLEIPDANVLVIRAKYNGEKRTESCPTPGNSACAPEDPDDNKRCVSLSSANDCVTLDVNGDFDSDGIADKSDNCPCDFNPLQEDIDNDGFGDSCFLPQYLTPFTIVVRAWVNGEPSDPPIDPQLNIRVTDPDGLQVGADSLDVMVNTYPPGQAEYHNIDLEDSVHIYYPKTGFYIVEIIPEAGSSTLHRAAAVDYAAELRTDGTIEYVFGPQISPLSGTIDTIGFYTVPYAFGDADGDGLVTIADAVYVVAYLFGGESVPDPLATADMNCDHEINLADVFYLMDFIFRSGPPLGCG